MMQTAGLLVSIILPTYNRAARIAVAIRSVIAQTYPAWELIVVDDASSDSTAVVVDSFSDPRIFRLTLPFNCGSPARPRNVGLQMARGSALAYIDDDNAWRPQHLERLLAALNAHPGAAGAYGGKAHHLPGGAIEEICHPGQGIDTQDGLHTRAALAAVPEGWVGNDFAHEDVEFWAKLRARNPGGLVFVPEVLSDYYIHSEQRYRTGYQNTRMYDRAYFARNPSRLADAAVRRELLATILACGPASVLDVGCGEAWLVEALGQAGVLAWGLDPSADLGAVSRAPGRCVCGRADALPCPDGAIDLVACIDVLQHIPEPRLGHTLRELARVGRRLLVAVDCADPRREGHRTLHSAAWWRERCQEVGLLVESEEGLHIGGLEVIVAARGGCQRIRGTD
ncbi:MAG TPA: glycosyltransferase [Anaerolineae bacterium]|nr:glycosyltransferase [Anaerolineae bacterium]HPL29982.1 glycosyltransferase [Anaerolineae bacterium]